MTTHYCLVCQEEISEARLRAIPNAVLCVSCKVNAGDEPRLRRLDEFNNDGEIISQTMFVRDQYIDQYVDRIMRSGVGLRGNNDDVIVRGNQTISFNSCQH